MKLDGIRLAVVFLVGCLAGGWVGVKAQRMASHRFWQHGPNAQHALQKFSRELNLDTKQQEAMKPILDKHHEKMMSLHQETAAKFQKMRLSLRTEIQKLLNPEQQKEFESMTKKWDARSKGRWKGRSKH